MFTSHYTRMYAALFDGPTVAVEGVGHVGGDLTQTDDDEGDEDHDEDRAKRVEEDQGVRQGDTGTRDHEVEDVDCGCELCVVRC